MGITGKGMQAKPIAIDLWLTESFGKGNGTLLGRITPADSRVFYFRYAGSKGQVRLPIGPYNPKGDATASFTVSQARAQALQWSALRRNQGIVDLREHFTQAEADLAQEQALERQRIADDQRLHDEAAQASALAQQRRLTVRQLFDRWRATDLQPALRADGKRTGRVDGGLYVYEQFSRHVFPSVGSIALPDLHKSDLLALLDTQKAAGKNRTANVLLAELKQMLDFAQERELMPFNPLASVKRRKVGGPSVKRTRFLTDEEIRLLVLAVDKSGMHPRNAVAIWVALATGVRIGELLGAVWSDGLPRTDLAYQSRLDALQALCDSKAVATAQRKLARVTTLDDDKKIEIAQQQLAAAQAHGDPDRIKVGVIDLDSQTWHMLNTKNQRGHIIHLSAFTVTQFESLLRYREVEREAPNGQLSPWVFPATDNRQPVCVRSLGKQLADRQRQPEARMSNRTKATTALMMPGGTWTAHDLRRTASTLMSKLGISDDVINECTNHIKQGVIGIYNQDRREAAQVQAFDALGLRLAELTSGVAADSNVVMLRGAA